MKYVLWAIIGCGVLIAVNLAQPFLNPASGANHVQGAYGLIPVLVILVLVYAVMAGLKMRRR